jgi:hypothetical protein
MWNLMWVEERQIQAVKHIDDWVRVQMCLGSEGSMMCSSCL